MTLSSRPIANNRHNPCPVCEDAKGNCRILEDGTVFCFGHSDARKGEIINGYRCVKERNGHTATFKPDNSDQWDEEKRREWEDRKRDRQRRYDEERRCRIAAEMPDRERDFYYRKLLSELNLNNADKKRLFKRGYTQEQIKLQIFKSVSKNQRLNGEYPKSLPGILGEFGNRLNIYEDSILCPIFNQDGLIVGCQFRLNDVPEGEGRYRWLTSATKNNPDGATPHLNGELPIAVYKPEGKEFDFIAIVEGTSIKPSLTHFRLGCPVVGSAGGNFSGSSKTLKSALSSFGGVKLVKIYPDAGDVLNAQVMNRWKREIGLFEDLGYRVEVAWWGQATKEDDDIDELSDLLGIEFITPENFFKLGVKDEEINSNGLDWKSEAWLKKRRFTAHKKVNQKQFTSDDNIPQFGVVAAIKSGLGTGKTEKMIRLMKEDEKRGRGSVIIGYINNLLLQTGARALAAGVELYHIHFDDNAKLMVGNSGASHSMCLDSIHHMDGHFKGKTIYLDEVCSVLSHATSGGTLGDTQAKVLKILKRALIECERVIILDGNLTDIHANFIARIANKELIKIENTQKIAPHKITFVDGIDEEDEIRKSDKSPLVRMILGGECTPWIFTDSKNYSKVLYKLLTDLGLSGHCLNSESSSEDWAKEFLENPDEFILKRKPDFFIGSPTVNAGLSVQVRGHFTHKFSFFTGVLATNSQHQGMFRLRDESIPHYVFCPERSRIRDTAQPHNYSAKKFAECLSERITQSSLLAGSSADDPEFALKVMQEAMNRTDLDWFGLATELGAIENYEKDNYRKCLIHTLEEAGHEVEIIESGIIESINKAQKLAKEEILWEEAKEIVEAEPLKSIEEANQKAKASPNKKMQRRIQKTRLLDRLPGIEHSEVWKERSCDFIYECILKNRQFVTQIQRYWMLKNYDISQKRHESAWNYAALGEDFFTRQVSAMSHTVVWALNELKLLELIEAGGEIHKDSPAVEELIRCLRDRRDIRVALRMENIEPEKTDKSERLRILNQLLNFIGYRTQSMKRKNIKTELATVRARYYKIVPIGSGVASTPPPSYIESQGGVDVDNQPNNQRSSDFDLVKARKAILEALEAKYTKWANSDKAKVKWEVEEVASTPPPSYIESQGGVDVDNQPNNQRSSDFDLAKEEPMNVSDDKQIWSEEAIAQSLDEMINDLLRCEDVEEMAYIRTIYPAEGLVKASRRIQQPEIRTRVRRWVFELNDAA